MSVMLAAFLTNAAMANVACRFHYGRRLFEISEIIEYEEIMETYKSLTLGMPKTARSSDSIITNAFALEMHAPFIAIILCQREVNGNAQQPPQSITERPQDYITSLEGPRDSIERVDAELIVFKSLLRSIRQLPASKPKRQYDVVMGFHPFVGKIHNYVRPIPTSATFVLRLILESYKTWCILPGENEMCPTPVYILSNLLKMFTRVSCAFVFRSLSSQDVAAIARFVAILVLWRTCDYLRATFLYSQAKSDSTCIISRQWLRAIKWQEFSLELPVLGTVSVSSRNMSRLLYTYTTFSGNLTLSMRKVFCWSISARWLDTAFSAARVLPSTSSPSTQLSKECSNTRTSSEYYFVVLGYTRPIRPKR